MFQKCLNIRLGNFEEDLLLLNWIFFFSSWFRIMSVAVWACFILSVFKNENSYFPGSRLIAIERSKC